MVYLGTSGFQFDDWVGTVYPENLKKSSYLKYYFMELGFNALEINFTYYSFPSKDSFLSMYKKTPNNFYFTVKLPSEITHRFWKNDLWDIEDILYKFLETSKFLGDKLKGFLAQFPYSFKFSEKNSNYILYLKRLMNSENLFVEFRHLSWMRDDVFELLKNNEISYVIVDEPQIERLFPYYPKVTTDKAYFRFHGRNENWFEAQEHERYDYLYSEDELRRFLTDILELKSKVKEIFVFFNNCYNGKAVKNAVSLKKMLEQKGIYLNSGLLL